VLTVIYAPPGPLLNWPRYIEDQRWFRDRVYPLVVQAGLR
jgi:hypothetical protein